MGVQWSRLADLLYPRCCPFCGSLLPFGEMAACRTCMTKVKVVEPPCCLRCGKSIESEDLEYCQDCLRLPKSYVRGFPVFEYSGGIKRGIYDFKYKNQRSYGQFFADCMYAKYKKELTSLQLDGLIPVPIHKKKRKLRGFNQTELMAKCLGKHLQVPVYAKLLKRVINTNPQKELNDKARMKNLKNAFIIGKNKLELKRVLIVDDIYTTGATIEACTKVLLEHGIEEVYYVSLAIGQGY